MRESIYRQMIEESSLAYIHIKVDKINGKYKKINMLDKNKTFDRLFKLNKPEELKRIFCNSHYIQISLDEILNNAIKNKKYSLRSYIENLGMHINVDIFSGINDEFHLKIYTLDENYMKLSQGVINSPFLAWIKDRNGIYMDVNNNFIDVAGKTYDEIIGKSDINIWIKGTGDIFSKQDKLVIENNQQYTFEENVRLSEKCEKYFQTVKWPYIDKNNIILGTVGIAIEITDKVQLRKNIEKNEQIFLEISNNIDDVIMIRDIEKALYISSSFEKIFGFNPENLYENLNMWHEDWSDSQIIDGTKGYECNDPTINTLKVISKKNDNQWLRSKFVPVFDENGNIIKKIGIISDITKSKELEDKIELLRMDFFANLSHEFRTPINLILSSIQVFMLKIEEFSIEEKEIAKKYLSIINQNGLRLLKLVNNLIDSTKIDSGNFKYNPQNYNIVSFVENICLSVSDFVERNNMSIIFDTDIEEKIISFDLYNMERIILNLLSNAIKFNKPDGKIKINISTDDNIRISIKDDGIGIPKDKQETVFKRFEQVKSKMETEKEGSGIGLFLVKSLVEMNDGQIILNSDLGKGSEFIVILPNKLVNIDKKTTIVNEYNDKNKVGKMNIEFSDIYIYD